MRSSVMTYTGGALCSKRGLLVAVVLALTQVVCAYRQQSRRLRRTSKAIAKELRQNKTQRLLASLSPSLHAMLAVDPSLIESNKEAWANELRTPQVVQTQAVIFLGNEAPIFTEYSSEGWVFAEDPTEFYDRSTPEAALRSFVRASLFGRWDVLLTLAPQRYRAGLSEKDLKKAWTEGKQADVLKLARDRIQDHLGRSIRSDGREAALELGNGEVVRFEREHSGWVIVDL